MQNTKHMKDITKHFAGTVGEFGTLMVSNLIYIAQTCCLNLTWHRLEKIKQRWKMLYSKHFRYYVHLKYMLSASLPLTSFWLLAFFCVSQSGEASCCLCTQLILSHFLLDQQHPEEYRHLRRQKIYSKEALRIIIVKVHYGGNGEKQSIHNLVKKELEHQSRLLWCRAVSEQRGLLCSGVACAPINTPLCKQRIQHIQGGKQQLDQGLAPQGAESQSQN